MRLGYFTLLLLLAIGTTKAEMYFDKENNFFFSYPASTEFNQGMYNEFAWEFHNELQHIEKNVSINIHYIWRMATVRTKMRLSKKKYKEAQQIITDIDSIKDVNHFNTIMGF